MSFLKLSIDLDAELSKITMRQHLNDVHYLVNLVRGAVSMGPQRVVVEISRQSLVLEQDGAPLPDQHRRLLLTLLGKPEATDQQRQSALTALEKQFGITFLSLFITFPLCTLTTGSYVLRADEGALVCEEVSQPVVGYRLEVRGERRTQSDELHEIRFFCAGAHIPIVVNGETVNKPIGLPDQLLSLRFEDKSGAGFIGLPNQGRICSLSFYKGGLRVGSKQFLRKDGLVYHAAWDYFDTAYEPNYARTIALAEEQINRQIHTLYQTLPQYFVHFETADKERVKKILFAQGVDWWRGAFEELEVFHAVGAPWSLSLTDLHNLTRRFYGIPYVAGGPPIKRDKRLKLPLLSRDEVAFLTFECGLNPRRVVPPRGEGKLKRKGRPDGSSSKAGDQLLAQLHHWDPMTRYVFTSGRAYLRVAGDGKKELGLPVSHEKVVAALEQPPLDEASFFHFKTEVLLMVK